MISIDNDSLIPGLKTLADEVHKHDTKIAAQLYHAGRYAMPFLSGEDNVSASSVYSRFSKSTSRTLSIDEIHEVQDRSSEGRSAPAQKLQFVRRRQTTMLLNF